MTPAVALAKERARPLMSLRRPAYPALSLPIRCVPSLSCLATPYFRLTSFLSRSCALFCATLLRNLFGINRLHTLCTKHPGWGYPPTCLSPKFRIFFQVPYAPSPLFLTLTKTAGVVGYSSHSG